MEDGNLERTLQLLNPIRYSRNGGAQEDLIARKQLEANHPRALHWSQNSIYICWCLRSLVQTYPDEMLLCSNVLKNEEDQNVRYCDLQNLLPVDFGWQQFEKASLTGLRWLLM